MRRLLFAMLLTNCAPTWYRAARVTEALAVGSLACDGSSTNQFLSESKWQEINPVLGRHPSSAAVWAYLGGIALLTVGANRVLPNKLAVVLNVLVLGVEVQSVAINMHVGSSACGIGDGGPWLPMPISKGPK